VPAEILYISIHIFVESGFLYFFNKNVAFILYMWYNSKLRKFVNKEINYGSSGKYP